MRVTQVTGAMIAGGANVSGFGSNREQLGIDRVFVISLPDETERRQHMADQFRKLPRVRYEFFDAIRVTNRAEYPLDYDSRARRRLFGDDLRPGEVGCYLSHREMWKRCANAPAGEVWCILEDDIVLTEDFAKGIRTLMDHQDKWDVVRLMELIPRRGSWTFAHLDETHILRAYDRPPSGAQGYLLTPAAARKLVALAARIVWPIDEVIDFHWQHKLRLYTLLPAAISLEPSFHSTIGLRAPNRRSKWRKIQRELINGTQGLQRKLFNLQRYGLSRRPAGKPARIDDSINLRQRLQRDSGG